MYLANSADTTLAAVAGSSPSASMSRSYAPFGCASPEDAGGELSLRKRDIMMMSSRV